MSLRIRKVYTYPCQCGDPCSVVRHTFSRRKAIEEGPTWDPPEMWSIFEGTGKDTQVIADCWTLEKARRVFNALKEAP